MSKVSTLSQAAGILTLLDEQKLDLKHVQTLRPYIVALARGVKRGTLPDIQTHAAIVEGRAKIVGIKYFVDFNKLAFIPRGSGLEILPDNEQLPNRMKGVMDFDPAKVQLHLADCQKNRNRVAGAIVRNSLKSLVVYGGQLLDFYLDNPHLIPEDWKEDGKGNTRHIFFWGTIYRHSVDRSLHVRYLFWDSGSLSWKWNTRMLDHGLIHLELAAIAA